MTFEYNASHLDGPELFACVETSPSILAEEQEQENNMFKGLVVKGGMIQKPPATALGVHADKIHAL